MARPKLADVAQLAGVGIGTASDALAGKNRIPEETRERVRGAAEALGYVPNPVARALSGGNLHIVGIVITALRYPTEFEPYRAYWGDLVGSAAVAATDRGYAVTVLPGLTDVVASSLPVAGLLVVTAHAADDDIDRAIRLGVPVVADGFERDSRAAGWVDLNYRGTVPMVMEHFLERGARRPSLLWGNDGDTFLGYVDEAYRQWCADHGLEVLSACADPALERLLPAVDELLDAGTDAIYTVVESVPEISASIEARGLKVGHDVLLVTLDDDTAGRLAAQGVSTIGLTGRGYSNEVVHALIDIIEHKVATPLEIKGDPTLHGRASSAGFMLLD
jgi:DNA-binding LacI/PurR family transcriptional regulator